MEINRIGRIDPNLVAQIMGPEEVAPAPAVPAVPAGDIIVPKTRSPFDDILNGAINSLEGVSKMENRTNALMNSYINGTAELSDVMIATSKMNLTIQLATAAVTSAVTTFKEITQMQI